MVIYNLVVLLYGFVIKLASVKKIKARQWVEGRKDWRNFYSAKLEQLQSGNVIWFHCASYGEFEQGRPLIEAVKNKYPDYKIVLTFFSPSGYEAFKNWTGADIIGYLPLDTARNAEDFIKIVKPKVAIFIKYEFWVNFLNELRNQNVRTYLVSAVFKKHHPFFKWYGGIFRKSLQTFNKLFIQDKASGNLLETIGIKNYEVSGDTRFDRVLQIKQNFTEINEIKNFRGNSSLIVAGSTWPKDEELILKTFTKLINQNVKLVIAPHEVDEMHIRQLEERLKENGFAYSLYTGQINPASRVLVLNTIGLLSRTYYYADGAYVGGGFSDGLHNTLEPAVYGIPVTFTGSDYVKYNEAVEMLELNIATLVHNEDELATAFSQFISDKTFRNEVKEKLSQYFETHSKTTEKILAFI